MLAKNKNIDNEHSAAVRFKPLVFDICSPKHIALGIGYTFVFFGLWLLCTSFETVPNMVSWYLPAGLRLAAFLVLPYRAWPMLFLSSSMGFYVLFKPGALLDQPELFGGGIIWHLTHFVAVPAVTMFSIWGYRRRTNKPFFHEVRSSLILILLAVCLSAALGALFLGRKVIAAPSLFDSFWSTWFSFVLGDIVGILVLTPILILLAHQIQNKQNLAKPFWITLLIWSTTIVLLALLTAYPVDFSYTIKHIAILPALFCAYQFGWRGAAISTFFVGLVAFVASLNGSAPPIEHQFYIISIAICCLILGAASSQLRTNQQVLDQTNKSLQSQNRKLRTALSGIETLSQQLIKVQEDERKSLSRDLHDDFGHRIVELKLELGLAKLSSQHGTTHITSIERKLDKLYSAMKTSIGKLRPSGIDTFSFSAILQHSDFGQSLQRANIDFQLTTTGEERFLGESVNLNLFRIVQEAISNSVKHANCSNIKIELTYGKSFEMTITDNGTGFDTTSFSSGIGIYSMKERTQMIGGSLSIFADENGTTVKCLRHCV